MSHYFLSGATGSESRQRGQGLGDAVEITFTQDGCCSIVDGADVAIVEVVHDGGGIGFGGKDIGVGLDAVTDESLTVWLSNGPTTVSSVDGAVVVSHDVANCIFASSTGKVRDEVVVYDVVENAKVTYYSYDMTHMTRMTHII